MKALIIGYGSIGSRHARVLAELGCDVAIVSKRAIEHPQSFFSVKEALKSFGPDYIVVANKTEDHFDSYQELIKLNFCGKVLVEKPLFNKVYSISEKTTFKAYVAYNLRFHPLIIRVKELVKNERVLSVQTYVGQYLPSWRPDVDYRKNYSASSDGGGVLLDLSHELDYLSWIFGPWERVAALGGQMSSLEIESDDMFTLLVETQECPAMLVQMNYLDRVTRREMIVNTDNFSIKVDLVKNLIEVNSEVEKIGVDRDFTYRKQHESLISDLEEKPTSLGEGLDILKFIAAVREAAQEKVWKINE